MNFLMKKKIDMSVKNPKLIAEQIIKELNIRNPSELRVRNIAMTRGMFVKEQVIDGAEGRLLRKGNRGIITINKNIPEEGRKRFAIAHEIGHFELHTKSQIVFCSDQDMLGWKNNNTQETEANTFAANLLMPEALFVPFLKKNKTPDMKSVVSLSRKFKTTITATALQYVRLSAEPCAVVISQNGVIKWYQKSSDFNFHVKVGEAVHSESYAFEFFNDGKLPDTTETVPAFAWIAGRLIEDSDIKESSFPLPRYNTVLSLLWIYEDICYTYEKGDDECGQDLTNPITTDGKRWLWD